MVSEITIDRLENVLTEVIDFSGTKEQTKIVSNMSVVNASPSGSALSGFITIVDERDGDTILARKVPGVIYQNSDLVNVLFIDGTEPIAFQQGSESSGDPIAVSKLVSPDLAIDPVISADNSGDVTLAGTGDLILPDDIIHSGDIDTLISLEDDKIVLQTGGLEMISIIEAATDEVVINDGQGDINFRVEGDTEENLLFTDAANDSIGIGTNAPDTISSGSATGIILNIKDDTNAAELALQGTTGGAKVNMIDLAGAASQKWMQYFFDGDFCKYRSLSDDGSSVVANNIFIMQASNGYTAIGAFPSSAKLFIDQASTTGAIPALKLDQADVSEEFLKLVGTAAAATLTQSFVDEGDVTTATRIGWYKINIDDIGNQITDGDYFSPFYSLA